MIEENAAGTEIEIVFSMGRHEQPNHTHSPSDLVARMVLDERLRAVVSSCAPYPQEHARSKHGSAYPSKLQGAQTTTSQSSRLSERYLRGFPVFRRHKRSSRVLPRNTLMLQAFISITGNTRPPMPGTTSKQNTNLCKNDTNT